jgi:hypothetical protein
MKDKESRKQCKFWMKRLIAHAVRGSVEIWMKDFDKIKQMVHVHAIVKDTQNEAEVIYNNLDSINQELG